ncbi:MAG TPA: hypothetical protein VFD30_17955 [Terriglobia bacterium]|jgi:hypothetical protein|nr:hypothetical protein [Terriglobia bacterium]
MPTYLNQMLGFDEVRWATMRKSSYDSRASFQGAPLKELLLVGTKLYRLVPLTTGEYFDAVWWIPEAAFKELHDDANRSLHGGGRLFRNYVAEFMALPSGSNQLCVVEIQLTNPVYAWVGRSAALFNRPGGMEQVFLPNLSERGNPRISTNARLVRTYWLKF